MIVIQVAGRLGADVETRVTPDGQKVHTFRLATNIRRGGRDETVWWRVTLWGDRWDKMLPYFTKGCAVIVIGEMTQKPEIYTNRDGQQQVSLDVRADIVKFSPFGRPEGSGGEGQQQVQGAPQGGYKPSYQPQQQPQQQQPNSGFQQPYGAAPVGATAGTASYQLNDIPDEDVPF